MLQRSVRILVNFRPLTFSSPFPELAADPASIREANSLRSRVKYPGVSSRLQILDWSRSEHEKTYEETGSAPILDSNPCVGLNPITPEAAAGPTILPRPEKS
jgi:hypothetical protein